MSSQQNASNCRKVSDEQIAKDAKAIITRLALGLPALDAKMSGRYLSASADDLNELIKALNP